MKELCNIFLLYLITDIQSITNGVITLKAGKSPVQIEADTVSLTPQEEYNGPNTLYIIDESYTVEKVSDLTALTFKSKRSSILAFKSGTEQILIGSLELPAKVSITSHLNKDRLILSSKSYRSPL